MNIIGGGGIWLMATDSAALWEGAHATALVVTGLGAGVNMAVLFWWPLLYGMTEVRLHHVYMLAGLVGYYILAAAGLVAGLGINALVMGAIAMNAIPRWASRRKVLSMIPPSAFATAPAIPVSTFWPMTWRAGLAAFASYLYLPATPLVCARVLDLTTAGSYGLSLQIALLVHAFSASWLSVKIPQITQLQARRQAGPLLAVFRPRMLLALGTYVAAAAGAIVVAPLLLGLIGSRTPLLPVGQLTALFLVVFLDLWVGMHAALIQSGNEVPHLPVFVLSGAATVILGLALGARWGVWGILAATFLTQIVCNYWWTPRLFWRRIAALSASPPSSSPA